MELNRRFRNLDGPSVVTVVNDIPHKVQIAASRYCFKEAAGNEFTAIPQVRVRNRPSMPSTTCGRPNTIPFIWGLFFSKCTMSPPAPADIDDECSVREIIRGAHSDSELLGHPSHRLAK
jgi:hypothetical protein